MQDLPNTRTQATSPADPAYHVARYVSVAGHPFIVLPVSVGALSVLRGGDTRAAAVIAGLFVVLSIAILVGIRTGRFNNFDVSEGQRRPRFYVLVIAATVALGFRFRDNPEALAACTIAAAVLIGCGLLNRWVKASLHTAFALYAAGLWGAWSIGAGFVALAIAALIAWSRIRLCRHSRTEVLVGAGIGIAAALCLILVARNASAKGQTSDDAPQKSWDTNVQVGSLSLHLVCAGSGTPTVVLDAGLGNDARAWSRVQPEVATFTRVCAYDRAGLGSSSPPPRPHSNSQMAAELRELLRAAKVPPPFVLVGHSMGGTNVRLFAASHYSFVAGMVLVDSSPIAPPLAEFPPQELAKFESNIQRMEGLDLKTFRAGFEELLALKQSLDKKPLVILIAGKPQPEPFLSETRAREVFQERQQAQRSLSTLSENSAVITVAESSHHVPLESPAVVVNAIRAVIESSRSGAALTAASIR
jgi:pimeloyl-ACP methyl ester carboxylesterase/membrane-associated phospholipid phosphatase